jgi:hypothetical protein
MYKQIKRNTQWCIMHPKGEWNYVTSKKMDGTGNHMT